MAETAATYVELRTAQERRKFATAQYSEGEINFNETFTLQSYLVQEQIAPWPEEIDPPPPIHEELLMPINESAGQ